MQIPCRQTLQRKESSGRPMICDKQLKQLKAKLWATCPLQSVITSLVLHLEVTKKILNKAGPSSLKIPNEAGPSFLKDPIKKKRKQRSPSTSSSDSHSKPFHAHSSDDDDIPLSNFVSRKQIVNDTECIFCDEKFTMSKSREMWVQCIACDGWAHEACTSGARDVYVCDFCK